MNRSNSSTYDGKVVWIACQLSLSLMTLILMYICICLAYFVFNKRSTIRVSGTRSYGSETNAGDSQSCYRREDRNLSLSKKKRKLRAAMRYACLFAGLATLTKFLADQLKFFYAWNARSDVVCEIVYDITDIVIFYLAYMAVYAFLWIKQWLFYCDPVAAKFLYSKRLVIFSRIFVCIMFLLSLPTAVVNWIPVRFQVTHSKGKPENFLENSSYLGCISIYDMREPSTQTPLILYCVLNAMFQCTLMGLFVYPLIWNRIKKWKRNRCCQTLDGTKAPKDSLHYSVHVNQNSSKNTTALGRRHYSVSDRLLSQKALSSIQRTVFWTAVCIVTDSTLVITFAVINVGTPMILTAVASDIVLLTNVLCIVATYPNWKNILFPYCARENDKVDITSKIRTLNV